MMQLYERVKAIAKKYCGSDKSLSELLRLRQNTFSYYLSPKSQNNLWPLLPKILEIFPEVNRNWLYFGEGEMCGMGNAAKPTISPSSEIWKRPKRITSEIPYPDDALGRIAQMTKVRASSALELQSVFGADFKEIKKFLSRYFQARDAREEWLVSGGKEEEMPPPPEPIPDEWLHYFWTHFGPNPGWVQNGERDSSHSPPLREWPRDAELERLYKALRLARQECTELREILEKKGVDMEEYELGKEMTKNAGSPTSVRGELPNEN